MKRAITLAVAVLAFTACRDASGPGPAVRTIPFSAVNAARSVPIPGDYIVTFRDDVTDVAGVAQSIAGLHNGALKHLYKSALKGFAVQNISAAAAAAIASDPRVVRVEADQVMTAIATQTGATWGLDRVDQRNLPLNNTYIYNNDGSNVTVYIIDTGINFSHVDFGGRARTGIDEITNGGTAADCNGHGTHVSGTVGGATYGVAKNVKLVAVRVLNCSGSGTTSGVIAGIDWVTANKVLPAAANMSLGGGFSSTLNQAVARSTAAGVTYAVAAGNSSADACSSSPSSEPSAITVGATDITDGFASFSNFGSCVDINAPGVDITSDWYTSNTATNTISGTSMASPHVAGAAALYLSANTSATPAQVSTALTSNATLNVLSGVPGGTVNLLLYTAFIGPGGPPPTPVLTASFTKSCSGLTCAFTNTSTNTTTATSYSWNFSDGSPVVTTTDASHTFAARRSYTVTLTATDAGVTSTASQPVTCSKRNCS
ncbi:MAG TPA: S8 family serine peptidase [Gemmatimonadaceae bacterium]|nr:S8 family serine peptidase [Gemmatimonadaceae bacterium]